MRLLRALLLTLAVLLAVSLPLAAWLALDDAPVVETPSLHRNDLAWVKSLFEKHDPRRQTPDVVQSVRLDESEINRLLNYAVELRHVHGVTVDLAPDLATVAATLDMPHSPFGDYLNFNVELIPTTNGIGIRSLQLGNLPVPGAFADRAVLFIHRYLRRDPTYAALADAFVAVHVGDGEATLDYHWRPELLTHLERKSAEFVFDDTDRLLMLPLAEQLEKLLKPLPRGSSVPLVHVLPELAAASMQLSGDARTANRAVLVTLAAYVGEISLPRLLEGNATSLRRAPRVNLTLHGRRDFAQHYIISAAVAVTANPQLASALGLVKEEDDAGHGSGFSFTDLGADRSGVRLGEAASGPLSSVVQAGLAHATTDADLMPDFRALPEFMSQAEFDRRYGPVGGPRYNAVITHIDAVLDAHPLLGRQK